VSRSTVIALLLSGAGVLGLVLTLAIGRESVREHLESTYRPLAQQAVEGGSERSRAYASTEPVTETAGEIADAVKPADERTTPAGHFLRYDEDIVTVSPEAGGGSRIVVDDEETGYRRGFVYLGGWWGSFSGPAESFRGGGPGGGK
jgi:hypothetical protein